MDIEKLRFPIGHYVPQKDVNTMELQQWIEDIESFPHQLQQLIQNITTEQLQWKYKPDGWMIKQVIHHCADSHMNSYIRFKLTLTEPTPTIKPYFEDQWANLPDSLTDEIEESLSVLIGLHKKWTRLLQNLTTKQMDLAYLHPEQNKEFTLREGIGLYAWHCKHHLAHIKNALSSKGNFG